MTKTHGAQSKVAPRALFYNVPGHGHITPSLPLVAELTRRGHQIVYYASAGFRRVVEGTGAMFRPYRNVPDDYFTARGLHGGRPHKVAQALLATAEELLPPLLEEAASIEPDYVLFDGMCPWWAWRPTGRRGRWPSATARLRSRSPRCSMPRATSASTTRRPIFSPTPTLFPLPCVSSAGPWRRRRPRPKAFRSRRCADARWCTPRWGRSTTTTATSSRPVSKPLPALMSLWLSARAKASCRSRLARCRRTSPSMAGFRKGRCCNGPACSSPTAG